MQYRVLIQHCHAFFHSPEVLFFFSFHHLIYPTLHVVQILKRPSSHLWIEFYCLMLQAGQVSYLTAPISTKLSQRLFFDGKFLYHIWGFELTDIHVLEQTGLPSQPIRRSPCELLICCCCGMTNNSFSSHFSVAASTSQVNAWAILKLFRCPVFGRFPNHRKDGPTTRTFYNL